ncbi:response regulator transcription factor [Nevskia sp.]|uniref:response regulator transcription factor n=1 Tax=Nevskia sp. TaxID=1929292 RepID=UPI003F72E106
MPPSVVPCIAIVDDDDSLRLSLQGLIRSLGFREQGYTSAEEFLADANACDCLLTDYRMPGASGLDLVRRLRDAGRDTPVILMTAQTEAGLRERALACGALCMLAKPFEARQLIRCLNQALPDHAVAPD